MRISRIRAKLEIGKPVLVTALHFADPSIYEMASLMGFDGLWLDMEHHAHSMETAQNLMRAARVGASDVIARPAKGEFMRLGRLLESGAQGLMYPRCDDAAEAAEVVNWAKFPPLGKRGCDGGNPDMPYMSMPLDKYLVDANAQTFIVIQLEDDRAIRNAYEIACVPGVDAIMLGPGDYSALGGFPGQMDHPRLIEATNQIASAAKAAGKQWGRPASSVRHAELLINQGARFLAHGADILLLKTGLLQLQADFASIGFTFNNQLNN